MVDSPRLPTLDLDVQKDVRFIARPFKMTQGDKGYVQPFRLTNAWGQYTVQADNLTFHATKPDGTIIEIEKEPARFTQENGVWLFLLPDEIAQAIGNVTGYFSVIDGDTLVASTTKFSYEVGAKFGAEIPSNNYVSALEELEKQFQDYLTNAHNQLNEQTQLTNESRANLAKLLDDLQQQTNKWLTDKTTEVDADIKQRQDALDDLNHQYQSKYNELVAKWNNQLTTINDQWDARRQGLEKTATDQWSALKDKFQKERDDAIAQANTSFANELKRIQDDWTSEKAKLEQDIADFKEHLTTQVQELTTQVNKLSNETVPGLHTTVENVKKQVQQLHVEFNSVDFSQFAKTSDVYDRQTVDKKVAEAGKVKTVNGNEPDSSGNVAVDLSPYADKQQVSAELAKRVQSVNGIKPDNTGDVTIPQPDLSPYAKTADLTDVAKKADLATLATKAELGGYVTTESMTSAVKAAQDAANSVSKDYYTQLNNQISKIKTDMPDIKYFDTNEEAKTYNQAHPDSIVFSYES